MRRTPGPGFVLPTVTVTPRPRKPPTPRRLAWGVRHGFAMMVYLPGARSARTRRPPPVEGDADHRRARSDQDLPRLPEERRPVRRPARPRPPRVQARARR